MGQTPGKWLQCCVTAVFCASCACPRQSSIAGNESELPWGGCQQVRGDDCAANPEGTGDKGRATDARDVQLGSDCGSACSDSDAADAPPIGGVADGAFDDNSGDIELAPAPDEVDGTDLACSADACSDGDPLTLDYCSGGKCMSVQLECDDGNDCTDDTMGACGCEHSASVMPGCCWSREDCWDGSDLTWEVCDDYHCLIAINPLVGCHTSAECENGNVCEVGQCGPDGWCTYEPTSLAVQAYEGLECCLSDSDCQTGGVFEEDSDGDGLPGPDNLATLDICAFSHCKHIFSPAECDCGVGLPPCPASSDGYLESTCMGGCICVEFPRPFPACRVDGQCSAFGEIGAHCIDNECLSVPADLLLAHCMMDLVDCSDNNPCTYDECLMMECYHVSNSGSGCCRLDSDCGDCDPCTTNVCIKGQCASFEDPLCGDGI